MRKPHTLDCRDDTWHKSSLSHHFRSADSSEATSPSGLRLGVGSIPHSWASTRGPLSETLFTTISRKRIYTHPNHELHFHLRWRVYTRDSSSFFLRLLKTGYIHIQVIVHQPSGSFDFSHSLVILDQYFQQFVSPVEFVSSLTQLEGTQCNSSGERIYGRKTHINLSNNHWSIGE